jgi:hypothetical protein
MKKHVVLYINLYNKTKRMLSLVFLMLTFFACQKEVLKNNLKEDGQSAVATNADLLTLSPNLLYEETFEEGTPFTSYATLQVGTSYGFTVATSPAFEGAKAGRFELRDTDPETSGGTRAEAKCPALTNPNRWYGFSAYFPSADYQYDSEAEIISQWHQGGGVSPSMSVITRYDKMVIEVRSVPTVKTQYPLGDVVKDKWQTYVIHINHSNGSDGLVEIWRDGVKIFTHNGPNAYDFTTYEKPKWKMGLYKWEWNGTSTTDVKKRVIFFDNVRLGNENASYGDMSVGKTVISDSTLTPTSPVTSTLGIKSFTLVNASTEKDVITITDGTTISLSKLKLTKVNIRANPSATAGNTNFVLTGPQSRTYSDNKLPYALMGDDGLGNYFFGVWGPPTKGSYTLKATPTSTAGVAGTSSTIHFTITK